MLLLLACSQDFIESLTFESVGETLLGPIQAGTCKLVHIAKYACQSHVTFQSVSKDFRIVYMKKTLSLFFGQILTYSTK